MEIIIVREPISLAEVQERAKVWHGDMIKAVADIEQGIFALGGEWHMDANNVLISADADQSNLWGFNIYPNAEGEDTLEYFSLVNIRPAQGNRSMEIADVTVREKIRNIVKKLIPELIL
jgi:hypothetical protein